MVTLGAKLTNRGAGSDCDDSKFEQVMTVSRSQIYLERKSTHSSSPLLLSGTISADGSVSAAGTTLDAMMPGRATFFALTGKIEGNEFTGSLDNRYCIYEVKMKR